MTIAQGTYAIGPNSGRLLVNVYKDGVAAKMGHDLTLGATSWSGKAHVDPSNPSTASIEVTVDIAGLTVLEGRGGAKALSEGDKGDIKKNIEKSLGRGQVTFRSTGVAGGPPNLRLNGSLTLNNQTRPITIDVDADDTGHVSGRTSFQQTAFGIKPFSAMLGALKVKDQVDVSFDLQLS